MTSARSSIFAAIEARLALVPGVASVERMPSGDPDAYPALAIYDQGQRIAEGEVGATRYDLDVTIEGHVAGGDGVEAHDALNDLYVAVVAALITDPPVAGAEEITEGDLRVAVIELADTSRIGFALDVTIQFATPRGDPSQLA